MPKAKIRGRRAKRKFLKSDPIPPLTVDGVTERIRYLRETCDTRVKGRIRTQAGGVMERIEHLVYENTRNLPEGILIGGWQVIEKDRDGKDIRSTTTYDLNLDELAYLRCYANGNEHRTLKERLGAGRNATARKSALDRESGETLSERQERFGRMLALAEGDPVLRDSILKAWDEESPALPTPEIDEGEPIPDLTADEMDDT